MKAYSCAEVKLAILQVGYFLNKKRFKFTEIEDEFDLFLTSKKIWAKETLGQTPSQKDYPLQIVLPQAKAEPEPKVEELVGTEKEK